MTRWLSYYLSEWSLESCEGFIAALAGLRGLASKLGADIFFVQIGANDGVSGDPIFELNQQFDEWHGIFVEPHPVYYSQLLRVYNNSVRYKFENVAIDSKCGTARFYYMDEQAQRQFNLPAWYSQVCSLSRDHVAKHFGKDIMPFIREIEVNFIYLNHLLERHDVRRLDLLMIDAEGSDARILGMYNWNHILPNVIVFEHRHISKQTWRGLAQLLSRHHYRIRKIGSNTLAIRQRSTSVAKTR